MPEGLNLQLRFKYGHIALVMTDGMIHIIRDRFVFEISK